MHYPATNDKYCHNQPQPSLINVKHSVGGQVDGVYRLTLVNLPTVLKVIDYLIHRVITVILASDERPRKSIQLLLSQRNMRSLRQVLRGISDILSPHNHVTSLYGA